VPRLLAAPDKFKGSATGAELAAAVGRAADAAGWDWEALPTSDGGEGFLEAMGGVPRHSVVRGPLGGPVEAEWRLDGDRAVVEAARACGLSLVGGAGGNDPVGASTYGVGQLVAAAVAAGAATVVVGGGGTASTDGGLGALRALEEAGAVGQARLVVACDVATRFLDAARVFGPQKGASPAQVRQLSRRLADLARRYRQAYGVDVARLPGSGAAGGLAGGLAALGAELVPGFELVAEATGLDARLRGCQLVVTGEGRLDPPSFEGKVVGGVLARARRAGVAALVVAGALAPGAEASLGPAGLVVLERRFGPDRSRAQPLACVQEAVASYLASPPGDGAPRR
jgi:glycerate kinase